MVEPCNYPTKFPAPSVAVKQYFRGATMIEAYWKSVAWPGEGLFIGEPLARPWGVHDSSWNPSSHELTLRTTLMRPFADYLVQSADAATGPWSDVVTGTISWPASVEIVVPNATSPYYRVVAVP